MDRKDPQVFIRMAQPSDIEACRLIDVEAWGPDSAATVGMLEERIRRYPFGNYVALDRESGLHVGAAWTAPVHGRPVTSWHEMTGDGTYAGCDPHADVLFGVNLSVPPAQAHRGIGQRLVRRVVEAAWIAGKRLAVLGARMPGYHAWQRVFSAEDYIRLRLDGDRAYFHDPDGDVLRGGAPLDKPDPEGGRIDPRGWKESLRFPEDLQPLDAELRFFLGTEIAGQRCRVFRLLPDYFPDPQSCGYGVLIGWENPEHPGFGQGCP